MGGEAGATARSIALLRAINVGGHTVKMDHLRRLFEEMGFGGVRTFIASGNVIFDAPGGDEAVLVSRIEEHLKAALGFEVATFLRSPAEMAVAATRRPFPDADLADAGNALSIGFLAAQPTEAAREQLLACRTAVDEFAVEGREVYWLCRKRISESAFSGARLEKTLGMAATLRNVTTVRKLAAVPAP